MKSKSGEAVLLFCAIVLVAACVVAAVKNTITHTWDQPNQKITIEAMDKQFNDLQNITGH